MIRIFSAISPWINTALNQIGLIMYGKFEYEKEDMSDIRMTGVSFGSWPPDLRSK